MPTVPAAYLLRLPTRLLACLLTRLPLDPLIQPATIYLLPARSSSLAYSSSKHSNTSRSAFVQRSGGKRYSVINLVHSGFYAAIADNNFKLRLHTPLTHGTENYVAYTIINVNTLSYRHYFSTRY